MTSATGRGLATVTHDGTVLDVWFPTPTLDRDGEADTVRLEGDETPQQFRPLVGPDADRGVARVAVRTTIASLDDAPRDTYDAYLRLHLLSHRLVRPHGLNLDGLSDLLTTVVWTSSGPCTVADFPMVRARLSARGPLHVFSVDKFPRLVDYVVPTGVRIADADRVRLGAHLAEGTTVMHEGFINVNAGTLGPSLIEGRISAGVVVGSGTDIGGSASVLGRLSNGPERAISLGENCLLGANAGVGITLGDRCVIEAGLYITAGTKVTVFGSVAERLDLYPATSVRADRLAGLDGILFRRNSVSGAVEATPAP